MPQLRIALCFLFLSFTVQAQSFKSTVREYKKVFPTYPYSDPNPIATMGKISPYFRYDGYTDKPVNKEWKVVELENEFIQVMILPEIGGKIWTAIEKATGKPFLRRGLPDARKVRCTNPRAQRMVTQQITL